MAYLPMSAFQRPMSYTQLKRANALENPVIQGRSENKWEVFHALVKAKEAYALNERDLSVLQGLLTFHPSDNLEPAAPCIIYPSNRKVCERLNGMADSTMRRHLRKLVDAGLLQRRDSNNGKRFCLGKNDDAAAFGFDLKPLLTQARQIYSHAHDAEAAFQACKKLKLEISLMRRDLFALLPLLEGEQATKLAQYWEEIRKTLRRKLELTDLQQIHNEHSVLLTTFKTELLDSTDSQNEQHIHNSNINKYESDTSNDDKSIIAHDNNEVPLALILKACPTLKTLYTGPIHNWSHFIHAVQGIYTAMGISRETYSEAVKFMGLEQASIVIASLLQRFEQIRSPGAYLRCLTKHASAKAFHYKPMVMALLSKPS